ncbi:ParA family protein [Brucella intermedia]|uniref:ParA family protein n=1 Tax=Brucella intermedia TaxID=94625 RepID=UPI00235FA92C|nr:ParA family protein [Brucella intermedia]
MNVHMPIEARYARANRINPLHAKRQEMSEPKVITIYTTKGGVGKTTTAIHLADYLHAKGSKVALIDADERAMLTEAVMGSPENLPFPTHFFENPAGVEDLNQAQVMIGAMIDKIEEAQDGNDYVIIDCGGYNSQASLAAAAVADLAIIPANTGRFDLVQTIEVHGKIKAIAAQMGKEPKIRVLIARVNLATNLYAGFKAALKEKEIRTFENSIPTYTAISEATFMGASVFKYRATSPAAAFMQRFAEEVVTELEQEEN